MEVDSSFHNNDAHNGPPPDHSGNRGSGGGGGGPMRRPARMAGEGGSNVPFSKMVFDGKRMRKAIQRRTVDYNHSVARWMQVSFRDFLSFF